MAIAESGGPTTQAGISYQNAIAALYLGRLLDSRPVPVVSSKKVIEVRVEAPEEVDDIVVTFANGGKLYIQAKESVSKANGRNSAWGKIWIDFEEQFNQNTFQRGKDKLQLCSGVHKDEIVAAKDLSERASTSKNYVEWQGRLTQELTTYLEHLKIFLTPEINNDKDKLLLFFASVEVEIAPRQFVEEDKMRHWMPDSNLVPSALFSLLRERVGGEARVRGSHTVENLQEWLQENHIVFSAALPIDELRSAIYSSSSLLRYQKNTIGKTGKHFSRNISKDITKWILETTDREPVGVLLDHAGTGKTVLIQEILVELEQQQVDVLAIKADQHLSGVQSLDDLQANLGIPIRLERLAGILASQKRFVVLIDQIDSLSLSMAHDQKALNLALDMISRLRTIPGVRILISCRRFDFNSDPRLKNLEGYRSFQLEEFSEEEIKEFLDEVGLNYNLLLTSTQKLLRTPLHLNLFLMAYESGESKTALQDRGFTSLQELYHLVWEQVIMKQHPDAPPAWEREQALILMAQYMDREQKTAVPKSLFTIKETSTFERAIQWLSSEGIVMSEGRDLAFFHQTFFDYYYARDFVEKDLSLVETLLASPQGLFQRPQLVQVLSYLRGLDDQRAYLKQLNALLKTDNLRYHLKNHLYRWIASIPSPTEHEWRLVKHLSEDQRMRSELLQFSNGNPGWFEYWRDNALSDLLDGDGEEGYEVAFSYLYSVIESRQKEVIEFLQPYRTKNQRMEQIVGNLILQIRKWKCQEAVEILEIVLRKVSLETRFSYYGWEELAQYDPKAFCRILRNFMDNALENYKRKKQERDKVQTEPYQFSFISIKHEINKVDSTKLKIALDLVLEKSSLYFLELFIPWLIEVVQATGNEKTESNENFILDMLFHGWYERFHINCDDVLNDFWLSAFIKLAHEQPQVFLEKIEYLSSFPYESTQFLVARVLREVPEQYALTSLKFLLNDPRRLKIGEYDDFESRQLIKSIFPFLQVFERQELENFILNHVPLNKQLKLNGYRYHDLSQLGLLQAIGYKNFSNKGKQRLLQLERKFPGYRIAENPHQSEGGPVGSPIDFNAARKMSDRQWLQAMTKYQGDVRHRHWLKGGAGELSLLLQEQVKNDPRRFYDLFSQCDDQLDKHYVIALLNGLVESDAHSDFLFMAIASYKNHEDWNILRTIAWAVEKRANEDVPEEIIQLLQTYLEDQFISEPSYDNEPFSGYLNTVRGSAMKALMRVYSENEAKYINKKWAILCYAVSSDNIYLRAGAIHELIYMIRHDRQRALNLFEQAIEGYPQLYQMPYTDDFCYWVMGKPFKPLIPHLLELFNNEKEEVNQRGAELIAISLISANLFEKQDVLEKMEELFEKALIGPVPHRLGIARILSNNLLSNPIPIVLKGLNQLMNDEDEEVLRQVGFFLYFIKKRHQGFSEDVRAFILDFAESRSVVYSGYNLGSVLWEQGVHYPEWTLSVIMRLLKNDHVRVANGWNHIDSKELIHSVINIYTDPLSAEDLQSRAMDTFDSLIELYSIQAQGLLDEWDRR